MNLKSILVILTVSTSTVIAHELRRCTMDVAPEVHDAWQAELSEAARVGSLSVENISQQEEIVIPIVFHVIHDGDEGLMTRRVVKQNVRQLNRYISRGTNFRFVLKKIRFINDPVNFRLPPMEQDAYKQIDTIRKKYRQDGKQTLNIITADLSSISLLGISAFPMDAESTPDADAVLITYQSMGGLPSYDVSFSHYNLGRYVITGGSGVWKEDLPFASPPSVRSSMKSATILVSIILSKEVVPVPMTASSILPLNSDRLQDAQPSHPIPVRSNQAWIHSTT